MKNRLFCRMWGSRSRTLAVGLLAAALLGWPTAGMAKALEWPRALARVSLPDYPEDTDAVMLLDEQVTTVNDNGEIKTCYRRAYKILRPGGRRHGRGG